LTVGMSGFSYRRFIAWTAPACVIWTSLYVGVVAAAAKTYREISDNIQYAGYLFVGVIVVFLLLAYLIKRLISRREARHLRLEEEKTRLADGDVKD